MSVVSLYHECTTRTMWPSPQMELGPTVTVHSSAGSWQLAAHLSAAAGWLLRCIVWYTVRWPCNPTVAIMHALDRGHPSIHTCSSSNHVVDIIPRPYCGDRGTWSCEALVWRSILVSRAQLPWRRAARRSTHVAASAQAASRRAADGVGRAASDSRRPDRQNRPSCIRRTTR